MKASDRFFACMEWAAENGFEQTHYASDSEHSGCVVQLVGICADEGIVPVCFVSEFIEAIHAITKRDPMSLNDFAEWTWPDFYSALLDYESRQEKRKSLPETVEAA